MEKPSSALVPTLVREVVFYEDVLLVAVVGDTPYVALRPITEFLGLDWSAQYRRTERDDVLAEEAQMVFISGSDAKQYEMYSLPLEFLPGWLFGITGSRLKTPELAEKLKRYRRECFKILWRELGQSLTPQPSPASVASTGLQYARDLALAVAQMAEEQMILQGQVETVILDVDRAHTRLDRAAEVVSNFHRRLAVVERRVLPLECVSDEQATEISLSVKSLSELLTRQDAQKSTTGKVANHYQGVFSELYRRFGVTKYTLVHQVDYQNVLTFLNDWREAAQKEVTGTNE